MEETILVQNVKPSYMPHITNNDKVTLRDCSVIFYHLYYSGVRY